MIVAVIVAMSIMMVTAISVVVGKVVGPCVGAAWTLITYMRVLQFGPVLDVVAKKAGGMKEQGFVVFRDVLTAATAMRSLQVPALPRPLNVRVNFNCPCLPPLSRVVTRFLT